MLADTHAHLYWDSFQEDLGAVMAHAKELGVSLIINVGVDIEKSAEALRQVSEDFPQFEGIEFYSSIGIHPQEAVKYSEDTDISIQKAIEELEKIHQKDPKKVVLIGECGLDYFFDHNPGFIPSNLEEEKIKEIQKKLFNAHIDLSKKLNVPLSAHIRDDRSKNPENSECWDEALEMLKDSKGILHCYSGLSKTTEKALKLKNFLISFAANITYPKNEYLRAAAKIIPLERIVLETDCPFLAPQSIRGQRNEPSSVKESAQLIAELKGISFEEVGKVTTENIKRLISQS